MNLILRVSHRLASGYHELQSLLVPISLGDSLRVSLAPGQEHDSCEVVLAPELEAHWKFWEKAEPEAARFAADSLRSESNLVRRAIQIYRESTTLLEGQRVNVYLQKLVPLGAGLGGGSGNAAATLIALRALTAPTLSDSSLLEMAVRNGSDVPAVLCGSIVGVTGRGDLLQPVDLAPGGEFENFLQTTALVVVKLPISSNTARAFSLLHRPLADSSPRPLQIMDEKLWQPLSRFGIQPWSGEVTKETQKKLTLCGQEGISQQPEYRRKSPELIGNFFNDFQEVVIQEYPPIQGLRDKLRSFGALHVMLAGSGSALVGFCPSLSEAEEIAGEIENLANGEGSHQFSGLFVTTAEFIGRTHDK